MIRGECTPITASAASTTFRGAEARMMGDRAARLATLWMAFFLMVLVPCFAQPALAALPPPLDTFPSVADSTILFLHAFKVRTQEMTALTPTDSRPSRSLFCRSLGFSPTHVCTEIILQSARAEGRLLLLSPGLCIQYLLQSQPLRTA